MYFLRSYSKCLSFNFCWVSGCFRYGKLAEKSTNSRSLLDEAKNTEMAAQQAEQEDRDKEKKVELDDEEQLARARQFDDWKDDHRRGYGNRHNMG